MSIPLSLELEPLSLSTAALVVITLPPVLLVPGTSYLSLRDFKQSRLCVECILLLGLVVSGEQSGDE